MRNDECLTEDEWQLRCLVQAKYPGFTRAVRQAFWKEYDIQQSAAKIRGQQFELDTQMMAENLRHLNIDLTVRTGEPDSSQVKSPSVAAWLQEVLNFENSLTGLRASEVNARFEDFVTRGVAVTEVVSVERPVPDTSLSKTDREHLVRYASWTCEEAVRFIFGDIADPEFTARVAELRDAKIKNIEPLSRLMFPADVLKWAREVGWKIENGVDSLEVLDPGTFDYLASKRKSSYQKVILGVAKVKYRFDNDALKRSPVADRISGDLKKVGLSLSSETIAKMIEEADEELSQ